MATTSKPCCRSSAKTSTARIDFVRDEVVDLDLGDDCNSVHLKTRKGDRLRADRVVLALGHPLPEEPQGLELAGIGRGYVADPWSAGALGDLAADEPIALVGSGLTAVDLIVEAHASGHRGVIYAISRHGLFPCRHQTSSGIPRPHIAITADSRATARGLASASAIGSGGLPGPGKRLANRLSIHCAR